MSKVETLFCMGCMSEGFSGGICPRCGYDPGAQADRSYLLPGTILENRYLVGALKGRNGGEAQYIGYDQTENRRVWIREYFPETLARRAPDGFTTLPRKGKEAQYKAFLSDFLDICATVERLGKTHSVIPIQNALRLGNTAYAIYSHLRVVSLESYLAGVGGSLSYEDAIDLLAPLFQMVGRMHVQGVIHRGLSPYTIYIEQPTGQAYLGDFLLPAARTAGSELKAELYNGYSAPEQYASNGWQGAWTDIYALGAIFYRTVAGVVPPKSTMIGSGRPLSPLASLARELPPGVSAAVEAAMQRRGEDRTQSVMQLLNGLHGGRDSSHTAVFDTALLDAERKQRQEVVPAKGSTIKYALIALLGTVALLGGMLWIIVPAYFPNLIPESSGSQRPAGSSSTSISEPSRTPEPVSSEPEQDKTVPDFTVLLLEQVEANSDYQERFVFDIREENSDIYPKGKIYDQAPKAGVPMPNRGTVILYVSKGPVTVPMPNLVGLTVEEAALVLEALGREYDIALPFSDYEVYEEGAEPDQIVRTSPVAGEEFQPAEQRVMLFVAMQGNEVSESIEIDGSDD